MINRRIFFLLFVLIFFLQPLYSQTITSVEIIGLRRTKPHVVLYCLEEFLGQDAATLDMYEVQAAIRDIGILEPIGEELIETEAGYTLRVTVEEKHSFFPIPIVMAGSGDFNAGVFLLDSNAFGQRDIMGLGGMYGTSGWMGMAMYNHSPGRKGLPGWNTMFTFNQREREDMDKDEQVHRRYKADQLRVSLGLNFPFLNYFSASSSVSFTNISLRQTNDDYNKPEDGATVLGFSPGFSFRKSSWDGFLLSQRSFSLRYVYNGVISGTSYHQMEFRGIFEQTLVPGFRLNLRSGAVWKPEAGVLFEEGPQKAMVDILPRGFVARHYAGFSAGLEKYIYKARWGTISAQGSWQVVFSKGSVSGFEFDNGPSLGISLYLSRLAIPAMNTGVAYNVNSGRYKMAFSMGMEF